jgi:hypothetical protein
VLGAVLAVGTIALTSTAMAGHGRGERMYRVTVTNATRGQPVAPSVIATHTGAFQLFELGLAPTPSDPGYDKYFGLATAAETGFPVPLRDAVAASAGVSEVVVLATDRTPPVLLPSESNSIVVGAARWATQWSAAAMLGATNDGFYAVRGVPLPRFLHQKVRVFANGYDAGSEANAETAATVVALGATDDDPMTGAGINDGSGEGFIHVHAGIHGVGGPDGLDPATYDWRDPVVELTIERIR